MKEKSSGKLVRDWRTWAVVICVIALVLVLVRCGLPMGEPDQTLPSTDPGGTTDPSTEASTDSTENTVPKDAVGNVLITGIRIIECAAGSTKVATKLENPAGNADRYYLVFEIRLPDDSARGYEVLYCSEPVEPGKSITNITLAHALEKNIYEAILHVQPLRMDEEKTPTNNVDLDILLVVE